MKEENFVFPAIKHNTHFVLVPQTAHNELKRKRENRRNAEKIEIDHTNNTLRYWARAVTEQIVYTVSDGDAHTHTQTLTHFWH